MALNWMRRTLPFALMASALIGINACAHHRVASAPAPPALNGDSIRLLSFDQIGAVALSAGKPARFLVRIEYTLTSYDHAILAVDLLQFANRDSCIPDAEPVVKLAHFTQPIERGTHNVETILIWPGDQARSPETGTISIQTSMWLVQPSYQFLLRTYGTQHCLRY